MKKLMIGILLLLVSSPVFAKDCKTMLGDYDPNIYYGTFDQLIFMMDRWGYDFIGSVESVDELQRTDMSEVDYLIELYEVNKVVGKEKAIRLTKLKQPGKGVVVSESIRFYSEDGGDSALYRLSEQLPQVDC